MTRLTSIFALLLVSALLISSAPIARTTTTWAWSVGQYAGLMRTLPLRPQHLHHPGGREAMERFHERLATTLVDGRGGLRVVHLGGSHVQAGWMGDRIRERWWDLAGTECSRGLISPYRMAGTNTPPKVRTEFTGSWSGTRCSLSRHQGPFGGTGLSAVTFDAHASWWHVLLRADSSAFTTTHLTVLGQGAGLAPRWAGSDTALRVVRVPLEGTEGWRLEFSRPVDTLFLALEPDTGQVPAPNWFRLHGLIAEQPACPCEGLVYHEVGNNGASTASVLRGAADDGFDRDWAALAPDLVIFGLGINDAHGPNTRFDPDGFATRYDSLIGLIRRTNPEAAFLFLTNTDSFYGSRPNPSAAAVREVMFDVAARHGAAVFDQFDAMGGLGSIEVWRAAGFAQEDRIHFTRAGYRVLADLYWDALMGDWSHSRAVHRRRMEVFSPVDSLWDRSHLHTDTSPWNS